MSESFNKISEFLTNQMRMSHIYQPIMLIELLKSGGRATITDIAKAFLVRDPTQVQYYSEITRRMPGRVLTQERKITRKNKDGYSLIGFNELTDREINKLTDLCNEKVEAFLASREKGPWAHRTLASRDIPGSVKYDVLSRAHGRCELCGVSKDIRALEADHIIPRSKGGTNVLSNLQALCYICNSSKRDHYDTDFRIILQDYDKRQQNCVYCEPPVARVWCQNELAYSMVILDPVTEGHTLIIPKRHTADYFALYQPELNAAQQILLHSRKAIQESDASVTGFSLRVDTEPNSGDDMSHCFLQLIPKRAGIGQPLQNNVAKIPTCC